MWEAIKPFLARAIAGLVASFAAWLQMKYGIILDPDTVAGVVSAGLGVGFILYSFIHRMISKKTDPVDSAVPNAVKPAALSETAKPNP
jgi:hypothetical protein